ncbi:hypothetical protein LJR039_001983 [Pseudorhodoferax sp. LjRoot39]|uniref:hypothetical protein n=1 Tax=Pseudorhodoferax sp. LjRoot39 TaxID=3342328 RepID=UPI003ECCFBC2
MASDPISPEPAESALTAFLGHRRIGQGARAAVTRAARRALFRGDQAGFDTAAAAWPPDALAHGRQLAEGAFGGVQP